MAVVVVADLLVHAPSVNSFGPAELLRHRPPVADAVRAHAGGRRLYVVPTPASALFTAMPWGPAGWRPEWRWALGLQEMLMPPAGARWGIDGSYDGDLTGLAPPALSGWTLSLLDVPDPVARRILALGNVGAVVHVREERYRGWPVSAEFQSVFASPVRLSRAPEPLPRVYVVGGWREAKDADAPNVLVSPGFDPWREAVVPEGAGTRAGPPGFAGQARETWRRADALAVETEATHPGLLVLVEGHHPAWTATVDGEEAAVLNVNTLFRGVFVPAGRHRVELRFRPRAAVVGAFVTLAGVLVMALTAARRP
jgi:hypothetical protein